MQNNITSMAHVIQALSNSIHKMDKLDKIDEIEARQKSSERMINDIVSDLRCELKHIKTPTANTPVVQTPSYTSLLPPSGILYTPHPLTPTQVTKHLTYIDLYHGHRIL